MKLTCLLSTHLPTHPSMNAGIHCVKYKGLLVWSEGWLLCGSQCRKLKLCSCWARGRRVCWATQKPRGDPSQEPSDRHMAPFVGRFASAVYWSWECVEVGIHPGSCSCSLVLCTSDPVAFYLLIWKSPGYCECGFPGLGFGVSARSLHFTHSMKIIFTGACQC